MPPSWGISRCDFRNGRMSFSSVCGHRHFVFWMNSWESRMSRTRSLPRYCWLSAISIDSSSAAGWGQTGTDDVGMDIIGCPRSSVEGISILTTLTGTLVDIFHHRGDPANGFVEVRYQKSVYHQRFIQLRRVRLVVISVNFTLLHPQAFLLARRSADSLFCTLKPVYTYIISILA